jgi:hypothetical protein
MTGILAGKHTWSKDTTRQLTFQLVLGVFALHFFARGGYYDW